MIAQAWAEIVGFWLANYDATRHAINNRRMRRKLPSVYPSFMQVDFVGSVLSLVKEHGDSDMKQVY